jgi:myo-inositol-1(or 4)-monophosphatase
MKGRRKAKTTKWAMKLEFETESRQLMATRSEKASNRFLDVAFQLGFSREPLG